MAIEFEAASKNSQVLRPQMETLGNHFNLL